MNRVAGDFLSRALLRLRRLLCFFTPRTLRRPSSVWSHWNRSSNLVFLHGSGSRTTKAQTSTSLLTRSDPEAANALRSRSTRFAISTCISTKKTTLGSPRSVVQMRCLRLPFRGAARQISFPKQTRSEQGLSLGPSHAGQGERPRRAWVGDNVAQAGFFAADSPASVAEAMRNALATDLRRSQLVLN